MLQHLQSPTPAHTHTRAHTHTTLAHLNPHKQLFLARTVYPSPALQHEPSSYGWEGWHSRGSANLPHALHVAQPLKYCSRWREARSQSLQQFTLLFCSRPTPLLSLSVRSPSFSLSFYLLFFTHIRTHREAYCTACYRQEALCQFACP